MIKLMLIVLLVHYALYLLFKPKGGILACGLFGWSGLKPRTFNRDKFDKLGILNETRGKHSCGITIDGEIYIGCDKTKLYRDFLAIWNDIPNPKRLPVVLGHTRHATFGEHSFDNAHPFGFGNIQNKEGGDYEFIGVHNGSLLNHEELAEEYSIDLKETNPEGKVRTKIDSEVLLEILYKSKDFKVLSKYNGAAALKWSFLNNPDVVYYFHGKTPMTEHGVPVEERPLYYWKQSKNSLYTSSLEDSLYTIGGNEETVGEFDFNTVYKVTNGDIENAVKIKISRNGNFQKNGTTGKKGSTKPGDTRGTTKRHTLHNSPQNCQVGNKSFNKNEKDLINIYNEEPAINVNDFKGNVYFNKLRYWRNGHKIEGFWTFVEGYGFYQLGMTLKDAESTFYRLVGRMFVDGDFRDMDKLSNSEINRGYVPFINSDTNPIVNPPIYQFYDGIRMETPMDLIQCADMEKLGKGFDAASLSFCALHPIIDLSYKFKTASMQDIYFRGEEYTGTICPLGSDRTYTIEEGNLISMKDIEPRREVVKDLIKKVEDFSGIKDDIQTTLALPVSTALESKIQAELNVNNDLIESYLPTVFKTPVELLRGHLSQLRRYVPNTQASRAVAIINSFITASQAILTLEEKE